MGGTDTGRWIVTFDKRDWGKLSERVSALQLKRGAAWDRVTFDSVGPAIHVEPGLGWATATSEDVAQRLAAIPGVRARREQVLERPETPWESEPEKTLAALRASFARVALLADDASRSWALQSVGIAATDDDGMGITVGVVDTGVEKNHPDLVGAYASGTTFVGSDPGADVLGHGTHVAGVIAGAKTPAQGPRYGIAPRAKIRSYRIYDTTRQTTESTLVSAVRAAIDDGCRIVVAASGRFGGDVYDSADAALGNYAEEHGALFIAAAGNESDRLQGVVSPTNAPANAPRVYAIGASLPNQGLWTRSNGREDDDARGVDWIAPGFSVLSANVGGTTMRATGTSVSAAVATGVAAALWSRNPSWRAADVIAALRQSAVRLQSDDRRAVGSGRIQL